ncbi:MAG: hypothetical protein LBR97_07315 [Dysgonamonadaceae bacterium]|jgi:hypothetical protein|nr:hypothetical protein [Dysgonamonadaceae bacterium]
MQRTVGSIRYMLYRIDTAGITPLGVGSACFGLKACIQTCRKRGRFNTTKAEAFVFLW